MVGASSVVLNNKAGTQWTRPVRRMLRLVKLTSAVCPEGPMIRRVLPCWASESGRKNTLMTPTMADMKSQNRVQWFWRNGGVFTGPELKFAVQLTSCLSGSNEA